jgi:hypothetical protein
MLPRIKWMMQVCTIVAGQTAATESGRPLKPSQTRKNTSATPRFFSSVSTAIQTFAVPTGLSRPAAPCASSRPAHVAWCHPIRTAVVPGADFLLIHGAPTLAPRCAAALVRSLT